MTDYDYQQLDELIHSRIRLAIMASLAAVDTLPFTRLRDQVGATDGNLSVHLKKLEEAGYVSVEKKFIERKPVTLYALSEAGQAAFKHYVGYLENLLHPATDSEKE